MPRISDDKEIILKSCNISLGLCEGEGDKYFPRRGRVFPVNQGTVKINPNEMSIGYNKEYTEVKNKIDKVKINMWNQIRRYTNNYEFPLRRDNKTDAPISRAFFKMWEIIYEYHLIDIEKKESRVVLSVAEAPGGFIQAIYKYMNIQIKSPKYSIYTMSLMNKEEEVPKYSEYINKNKNIKIMYGDKKNGDLYDIDNINSIRRSMNTKAELITGDGGFNEDNKYNIKEQLHNKLFLSEIIIAISNQKFGGKFVIKFFDTYTRYSLDLIYILLFFYKDVDIYKPKTSRPTNSEKYIICRGFKKLSVQSKKITNKLKIILPEVNESTYRILNIDIPIEIINRVRENNIKLMNKQINSINKNIELIKKTKDIGKLPYLERNNERYNWLIRYNLNSSIFRI
jgi:23S rRNA U2552 (ribose-2'-O)-methylase RlmE/FtsJ